MEGESAYYVKIDCKTVGFFLKISKEIGKAWRKSLTRASLTRRERLSPVSLSVFSLIPDLLFDCSRVLEYAKIRTVLQSNVKSDNTFAVKNRRVKVRRRVKGCVSTCIQPSILR